MHDSMARLYEAAKQIKEIEGQTPLANLLGKTPQVVNNWESRGISAEGALKAQEKIGCDANWVMRGIGEMRQSWPFERVSVERYNALDAAARAYVEGKLAAAIEQCESTATPQSERERLKQMTTPRVFPPKSRKKLA